MQKNRSVQIKAGFLLVLFALNTIVGFACAMGLNMGFNNPHHGLEGSKPSVHIHKDGKKHVHKAKTAKSHHGDKETASKKDDCCKDKVVKLQSDDKNLQFSTTNIDAPVSILQKYDLYLTTYNSTAPFLQHLKFCHFHPPPRDIRVAIQSFQI